MKSHRFSFYSCRADVNSNLTYLYLAAGKEAAAEALGALVWVSFGDSEQRDIMRSQVN